MCLSILVCLLTCMVPFQWIHIRCPFFLWVISFVQTCGGHPCVLYTSPSPFYIKCKYFLPICYVFTLWYVLSYRLSLICYFEDQMKKQKRILFPPVAWGLPRFFFTLNIAIWIMQYMYHPFICQVPLGLDSVLLAYFYLSIPIYYCFHYYIFITIEKNPNLLIFFNTVQSFTCIL